MGKKPINQIRQSVFGGQWYGVFGFVPVHRDIALCMIVAHGWTIEHAMRVTYASLSEHQDRDTPNALETVRYGPGTPNSKTSSWITFLFGTSVVLLKSDVLADKRLVSPGDCAAVGSRSGGTLTESDSLASIDARFRYASE